MAVDAAGEGVVYYLYSVGLVGDSRGEGASGQSDRRCCCPSNHDKVPTWGSRDVLSCLPREFALMSVTWQANGARLNEDVAA